MPIIPATQDEAGGLFQASLDNKVGLSQIFEINTFFIKEKIINVLGFVGSMVSDKAPQLSYYSRNIITAGHRQQVKNQVTTF